MARHAQPRELAKAKGALKKHPERYRKVTPRSEKPLGDAPKHLSAAAKKTWNELLGYCLPGVMTGSDRTILELTANLLAEYRLNPVEFAVGKYAHLIGCLARLGMSPADRQKLGTEKPSTEDDPFKDF